jgi:hypothetical protein
MFLEPTSFFTLLIFHARCSHNGHFSSTATDMCLACHVYYLLLDRDPVRLASKGNPVSLVLLMVTAHRPVELLTVLT